MILLYILISVIVRPWSFYFENIEIMFLSPTKLGTRCENIVSLEKLDFQLTKEYIESNNYIGSLAYSNSIDQFTLDYLQSPTKQQPFMLEPLSLSFESNIDLEMPQTELESSIRKGSLNTRGSFSGQRER